MSSSPLASPIPFGKYLLVDKLGHGGMAEVWKAKMLGPAGFERSLVIKRILPHLVEDPSFVRMFIAEARLSARLTHANVVQVFEFGELEGEYFLAMEYVRGRDLVAVLRAVVRDGSRPDPGFAALVSREVCRALGYAHSLADEQGQSLRIVHRDVSPSNVMVSFDGSVKLLDFGIAKALAEAGESHTQTGAVKGKFGYLSPEQIEGRQIDHRSDLFAAGILLYEMLTGKRLFKGDSDVQTLSMIRNCDSLPPPSTINATVPAELDRICMRALAKDRDARYQTGEEMATELSDVVHSLKWGPERLAAFMKQCFAEPVASHSASGHLGLTPGRSPVVPAPRKTIRPKAPRPRLRRKLVAALAIASFALAGAATWFALTMPTAARALATPHVSVKPIRSPASLDVAPRIPVGAPTATGVVAAPVARAEPAPLLVPKSTNRTRRAAVAKSRDIAAPTETPSISPVAAKPKCNMQDGNCLSDPYSD